MNKDIKLGTKVKCKGYIGCYKVYYAMGKSRLVHVSLLKKE